MCGVFAPLRAQQKQTPKGLKICSKNCAHFHHKYPIKTIYRTKSKNVLGFYELERNFIE
jgi:hypothetical protein